MTIVSGTGRQVAARSPGCVRTPASLHQRPAWVRLGGALCFPDSLLPTARNVWRSAAEGPRGYPGSMNENECTAPRKRHEPGSKQELDCPKHGAAARRGMSASNGSTANSAATLRPDAVRGRAAIEVMITAGRLELVLPDARLAATQLEQAHESLTLASEQAHLRPEAALTLAYDAARKVVAAMLEAQGLRARMPNAHVNVQDVLRAQWGDSLADRFDTARKARNRTEYPSENTRRVTAQGAAATVALAQELFRLADEQIPSLRPFPR